MVGEDTMIALRLALLMDTFSLLGEKRKFEREVMYSG